jgi:hypothetical protein
VKKSIHCQKAGVKVADRSKTPRLSRFYAPFPQCLNRSAYSNENSEFDELGCMKFRFASINDLPIKEADRKCRWERKA